MNKNIKPTFVPYWVLGSENLLYSNLNQQFEYFLQQNKNIKELLIKQNFQKLLQTIILEYDYIIFMKWIENLKKKDKLNNLFLNQEDSDCFITLSLFQQKEMKERLIVDLVLFENKMYLLKLFIFYIISCLDNQSINFIISKSLLFELEISKLEIKNNNKSTFLTKQIWLTMFLYNNVIDSEYENLSYDFQSDIITHNLISCLHNFILFLRQFLCLINVIKFNTVDDFFKCIFKCYFNSKIIKLYAINWFCNGDIIFSLIDKTFKKNLHMKTLNNFYLYFRTFIVNYYFNNFSYILSKDELWNNSYWITIFNKYYQNLILHETNNNIKFLQFRSSIPNSHFVDYNNIIEKNLQMYDYSTSILMDRRKDQLSLNFLSISSLALIFYKQISKSGLWNKKIKFISKKVFLHFYILYMTDFKQLFFWLRTKLFLGEYNYGNIDKYSIYYNNFSSWFENNKLPLYYTSPWLLCRRFILLKIFINYFIESIPNKWFIKYKDFFIYLRSFFYIETGRSKVTSRQLFASYLYYIVFSINKKVPLKIIILLREFLDWQYRNKYQYGETALLKQLIISLVSDDFSNQNLIELIQFYEFSNLATLNSKKIFKNYDHWLDRRNLGLGKFYSNFLLRRYRIQFANFLFEDILRYIANNSLQVISQQTKLTKFGIYNSTEVIQGLLKKNKFGLPFSSDIWYSNSIVDRIQSNLEILEISLKCNLIVYDNFYFLYFIDYFESIKLIKIEYSITYIYYIKINFYIQTALNKKFLIKYCN